MADISTKMGVTGLSQYKNAMNQAKNAVKTLDQELKKNEAQYKASGDKEQYMADKAKILDSQLKLQSERAKQAESALKQMQAQGVNPLSKAYQDMEREMLAAQTAMLELTAAGNELKTSEQEAASGADQLTASVNGINKKVSLDAVIGGINKVTAGLENAAKKAIDLGEAIWDRIMESAKWADDSATMAMMYGVDLDTFLRVQKLVANGLDTSVEAILQSQAKLKKNVGSGSDSVMDTLRELGLLQRYAGKFETEEIVPEDSVALFWEAGQAIMALNDAYEQEDKAQTLFGRKWRELVPLFTQFSSQSAMDEAMAGLQVETEEEVSALADLNDKVATLKSNFETLEHKITAGFAPTLTKASEALSGLLEKILEYLDTPEGKQALDDMATAVSGLFEDLGEIEPEKVVSGLTSVFDKIIGGLEWLVANKNTVIDALKAIVIGWGALKLTGGALEVLRLINGAKSLIGGGSGTGNGTDTVQTGTDAIAKTTPAWLTALTSKTASMASMLTMYDPTGLTAMLPMVVSDKAKEYSGLDWSGEAIQKSAEKAVQNYVDYGERLAQATETITGVTRKDAENFFEFDLPNLVENWQRELFGDDQEKPEVEVEPVITEEEMQKMQEWLDQQNPVTMKLKMQIEPINPEDYLPQGTLNGSHANGLPFVPFDGYVAALHRGERVLTASENKNYTYNSNTYFGSVNLNNGIEVDALAESIAKQNRKQQKGYGA